MKLILSTKAGGNVVSMPKMTPIFFTIAPWQSEMTGALIALFD